MSGRFDFLHRLEGHDPLSAEDAAQLRAALPRFLLFAITWSVGATCDKTGRIAFDLFLRSKAAGKLRYKGMKICELTVTRRSCPIWQTLTAIPQAKAG